MARQRYYGEKFKPTKGAFGNKSKYQKSLERQAELRKQIAEFEENQKQKQEEADKASAETSETKPAVKKKATKKTKTENVSNPTE
tara:strand:+ start:25799 stop:26053 length:255 start_codon:yes stop_codon:yes gene_type:complete